MISKEIMDVLWLIITKLKNQNINWVLIGSTSLALQNVNIVPKDIDILTDKKGIKKISILLKSFETEHLKFGRSEIFESYLGKFAIRNVKVEVMANLRHKIGTKWANPPKNILKKIIRFGNIEIPIFPLEEELKIYKRLKRKKDFLKIKKIKEILKI